MAWTMNESFDPFKPLVTKAGIGGRQNRIGITD